MALQTGYKKYKRGQRQADVETDFSNGMMYTDGVVSEGYVKTLVNFDFTQDSKNALKPRAALVTNEVITPDMSDIPSDISDFLDNDTLIKYSKECVEDGHDYRQFILGKTDLDVDSASLTQGKLWLVTSRKSNNVFEDVVIADSKTAVNSETCAFYNTALTEIHGVELTRDAKAAFPVGAFLGNSFYFFNDAEQGTLKKTIFNTDRYEFTDATIRSLTASEAVNYGYNMLSSNPYTFEDRLGDSSAFEMEGILPYDKRFTDSSTPNLLMTPKPNTRIWFRCNYSIPTGQSYRIVWSWKELTSDEWTVFHSEDITALQSGDTLPVLQAELHCPAKEIMVRCEAYRTGEDTVERAMTVGFDFTINSQSTTVNVQPEIYDLSTATGMISWKNRLVVWGVPKDPTILFISDLDEPGYFPYPNNITVFEEPIIAVSELMDNLIVFTKSKVHQVSLNDDGYTWSSTVIQSNLYIEPWDKHLIQTVRNMVYFKSGNYYYMIVPKAQSTTGELTLAPITNPISEFFNHFRNNVTYIFKECFKTLDEDSNIIQNVPEDLLTYYNFIDYENIHNFYVYEYDGRYVHFDVIYNVVSRYWKINIYETAHFLYPFRNDATHNGILAITNVVPVVNLDDPANPIISNNRIIQLCKFDSNTVEDSYICSNIQLEYYTQFDGFSISDESLQIPSNFGRAIEEHELLLLDKNFIRTSLLTKEQLSLVDTGDWINGFNRGDIKDSLQESLEILRDTTVFPNKQMLDTGYRDMNLFTYKRYRELQLQINNLDNSDMEFGMDFQISGEPRNTDFLYEVSQTIDEMNQDVGIVYLDATPYLPVPYIDEDDRYGEVEKVNQWTIKHSLTSDISLWKVRAAVSGKGSAPRLRLFTRNMFNYQLLGLSWVYREMNMR